MATDSRTSEYVLRSCRELRDSLRRISPNILDAARDRELEKLHNTRRFLDADIFSQMELEVEFTREWHDKHPDHRLQNLTYHQRCRELRAVLAKATADACSRAIEAAQLSSVFQTEDDLSLYSAATNDDGDWDCIIRSTCNGIESYLGVYHLRFGAPFVLEHIVPDEDAALEPLPDGFRGRSVANSWRLIDLSTSQQSLLAGLLKDGALAAIHVGLLEDELGPEFVDILRRFVGGWPFAPTCHRHVQIQSGELISPEIELVDEIAPSLVQVLCDDLAEAFGKPIRDATGHWVLPLKSAGIQMPPEQVESKANHGTEWGLSLIFTFSDESLLNQLFYDFKTGRLVGSALNYSWSVDDAPASLPTKVQSPSRRHVAAGAIRAVFNTHFPDGRDSHWGQLDDVAGEGLRRR